MEAWRYSGQVRHLGIESRKRHTHQPLDFISPASWYQHPWHMAPPCLCLYPTQLVSTHMAHSATVPLPVPDSVGINTHGT